MTAQQAVAHLDSIGKERRSVRRISVECPAVFTSLGGAREGVLVDISSNGGRLKLDDTLSEGTSGMLRWADHECFCSIVWTKDGVSGLVFDEPIPPDVIQRTITVEEVEIGPVANFGNIPLGQKRSRLAKLRGDA